MFERGEGDRYKRQETFLIKRRPDGAYDFTNEKGETIVISFHPMGDDRFLGQAKAEKDQPGYGYAVFRITGTEAFLYAPQCDDQDRAKVEALGVEVNGQFECVIDRVKDVVGLFGSSISASRCQSWCGSSRSTYCARPSTTPRASSRLSMTVAHVADDVVGDDRVRFRGRMDGAAVEPGIGRLQDVEQRDAFAMGVGGQERVVRRAEQPPVVRIGQRRGRRIRLELVAPGRRGTRMLMPSASARFGSRAHMPRLVNSGMWSVTSLKPVPAPVARFAGQPARLLPCGDAFEPPEEVVAGSRRSPSGAAGCSCSPDARRCRASAARRTARRSRRTGSARRWSAARATGATPKPSCSASLSAFMRSSSTSR